MSYLKKDEDGFLYKSQIPLEFCAYCKKFNRRSKRCTANDRGTYVCVWDEEKAKEWADDMVTLGLMKSHPFRKEGK
jgi:hypothetical protein